MLTVYPVILAGGTGTRIWPQSRTAYPKQFLNLHNPDLSMLQETLTRLDKLTAFNTEQVAIHFAKPCIISNEEHRFLVAEQLRQINQQADILLEPVGRNTAAAIALASLHLLAIKEDPNAVLLVLPADHVIEELTAFHYSLNQALKLASHDHLVTFGVVPNSPATGYGYIKRGDSLNLKLDNHSATSLNDDNHTCHGIEEFVEKPDLACAEQYLNSGDYLWNSGMFMFKAHRYLSTLDKLRPDIHSACVDAYRGTSQDLDFIRIDKKAFELCPSESIDYAVMEPLSQKSWAQKCRAQKFQARKSPDQQPVGEKNSTGNLGTAVVVPLDAGWNDIGSWAALWDISAKDSANNVIQGDVITHQSSNNYLVADHKLVATVGIKDLIVVDIKDALLVASKSQVQDVKHIVDTLKQQERIEQKLHRDVYRPWGKYDLIFKSEQYQVKHITVNPGAKLSVQLHNHRAEHWIVVSGTAKVTNGENSYLLNANQSTYIPIGQKHALENPEETPLEMIEVQSGSYLGEDDIIRFADKYGREQ